MSGPEHVWVDNVCVWVLWSHSEALREPSRVMLSSGLSRVATAAESGVLYTTVRRRPKQRLWILPTPPGLGSVVMANVLLIYVLLTFRV